MQRTQFPGGRSEGRRRRPESSSRGHRQRPRAVGAFFQNPHLPRPEFKISEFPLCYCFSCVNDVLLHGHIFVFTAASMSLVSPTGAHPSRLKT